jgi:hypothetical protein
MNSLTLNVNYPALFFALSVVYFDLRKPLPVEFSFTAVEAAAAENELSGYGSVDLALLAGEIVNENEPFSDFLVSFRLLNNLN